MKIYVIFVLVLTVLLQVSIANENPVHKMRLWTSIKGTTVKGKLVLVNGNLVTIKTNKGRVIELQMKKLSVKDREYIKQTIKNNRRPIVVAFFGGVDGFRRDRLTQLAKISGHAINIGELVIANRTTSKNQKRNEIVLDYGEDRLKAFFSQWKDKPVERFLILNPPRSILAHPKLSKDYKNIVNRYQIYAKKHGIKTLVLHPIPLHKGMPVQNYDNRKITPEDANIAVANFLNKLKGWQPISMIELRRKGAKTYTQDKNQVWIGRLPSYIVNAAIFSAITKEKPPLLLLKKEELKKLKIDDPSGGNADLGRNFTLDISDEALRSLSLMINEVMNK